MRPARIAVALLVLCAGAAQAELRALLVGVSGYPSLPPERRLQGPRNDVPRWRELLVARGAAPERIVQLADGVPGAQPPTRAAILGALDTLAEAAQPGDTVVVVLAGHGSRQPAGRDERAGLVPIFLPLDIGRWDGAAQTVANAITGADLRARIDRIAERGAFVWGVVDACHSAALVRGEPAAALQWRQVDPALLGVPEAALAAAEPRTRGQRIGALDGPARPAAGRGNTAFFYAAQVDELTAELALPPGDPQRRVHGLFSHVLAQALERGAPMSYRQLGQAVLAAYGPMAQARATPLFTGDGLDAAVLGQRTPLPRRWPLQLDGAPSVAAGALAGIVPGAVFALMPGPLARDDELLGHLKAVRVDALRAELEPVAHAGRPAPARAGLQAGQSLRLVASPPAYALRVAVDASGCAGDCPLREAAALLRAQGAPGVELQWVEPSAAPDVLVRLLRGRAVLLTPALQGADLATQADAPGPDTREAGRALGGAEFAERLGRALHAVARARNLVALGARFAAETRSNGLRATLARAGSGAVVTPEQVATLRDGDMLSLVVENGGAAAVDLTVLYVDADHGIAPLFPTRAGDANRLMPGERRVVDDIRVHAPPAGIERLLLVSVQARARTEHADLSFLAQPALARRRGEAAQALDEELAAFADAAFADHRTRGEAQPASPGRGSGMVVFTLDVRR